MTIEILIIIQSIKKMYTYIIKMSKIKQDIIIIESFKTNKLFNF